MTGMCHRTVQVRVCGAESLVVRGVCGIFQAASWTKWIQDNCMLSSSGFVVTALSLVSFAFFILFSAFYMVCQLICYVVNFEVIYTVGRVLVHKIRGLSVNLF